MFSLEGLRRIQELELSRRRVFVRADVDCLCTSSGQLLDDSKVVTLAQTVRLLLDGEAHVIVGGHRNSAGPNTSPASLEPVAARLAELLQIEVFLPEEVRGQLARKLISELRDGRIVMLENLELFPEEANNDEAFARGLAEGVDVYIGDCLTSPGPYASLKTTPKYCSERAMGLGLESELTAVNRLLRQGGGRSVLLLGQTFEVQRLLLQKLPSENLTVCAGGALAATLLAARGINIDGSMVETNLLAEARTWLQRAEDKGVTVLLPLDARVSAPGEGGRARDIEIGTLGADDRIVDLGPKTVRLFCEALALAPTVAMLSPLGREGFEWGTRQVLEAVSRNPGFSVVCQPGLHTAMSELSAEQLAGFGFISTAGQGFVDALCGQFMPTVEALRSPS